MATLLIENVKKVVVKKSSQRDKERILFEKSIKIMSDEIGLGLLRIEGRRERR
jgi:hypothetical protein